VFVSSLASFIQQPLNNVSAVFDISIQIASSNLI